MRLLIVSNLYPPFYVGGYELACEKVTEALTIKGHDIHVLTSTYGITEKIHETNVSRRLQVNFESMPHWRKIIYKEMMNQKIFRRLCCSFMPDVVFFWNLTHISMSLAFLAQEWKIPSCYYIFDNWIANWEKDHWYRLYHNNIASHPVVKNCVCLLGLYCPDTALNLTNAIFASDYLRRIACKNGKHVEGNRILYWGIDSQRFMPNKKLTKRPVQMLYVGQIVPHKGIHTIIQALDILLNEFRYDPSVFQLTIVGDTKQMPEYVATLKESAKQCGIDNGLRFIGKIENNNMPDIYAEHDILIFPSVWEEPFGITQLEAMASGLAVISTATGGSAEIIQDSVNALTFEKENARSCAQQIVRLVEHPRLFESITNEGRKTIEQQFQFTKLNDALEEVLFSVRGEKQHLHQKRTA